MSPEPESADTPPDEELRDRLSRLEARLAYSESKLGEARLELHVLTHSVGYRIVARVRRLLRTLAPAGTARGAAFDTILRGVDMLQVFGWRPFARRLLTPSLWLPPLTRSWRSSRRPDQDYATWVRRHEPGAEDLRRLRLEVEDSPWRAAALATPPRISVLMACRDPDPRWFRQAVRSVTDQVYPYWELVIVDDGSPRPLAQLMGPAAPRLRDNIRLLRPPEPSPDGAGRVAFDAATGDYVCWLGQHDLMSPRALFDVASSLAGGPADIVYTDEDRILEDGRRSSPFFKPDWSPALLQSLNYLGSLLVVRRSLVEAVGGPPAAFTGEAEAEFARRCAESASAIRHVAAPLYTRRLLTAPTKAAYHDNPYEAREEPLVVNPRYELHNEPLVSIVIPTRDRCGLLRACIESVELKTSYKNYEILIVDNGSQEKETLAYLRKTRHHVLHDPRPFNFAALMNAAAGRCRGDYLLFLNNDTEVINDDWLEAMLQQAQRPGVAIVGARLLYYDGSPQHEGTVMGLRGLFAGHLDAHDYPFAAGAIRDVSAVTAACMLIARQRFFELGCMDEALGVAWNDVDLCLRARQAGYHVVYTPLAQLYHREGASRGTGHPIDDDRAAYAKWGRPGAIQDPYYNANLDLMKPFALRRDPPRPPAPD